MAKTGTALIALFRSLAGENAINPTATEILVFLNLARNGDESPLLDLYPQFSSEMGTMADPIKIDLIAATTRYPFVSTPNKISKVWVKYSADDDYYPVEYLVHQRIEEGSPMVRRGRSGNRPVIGIYNNGFDIHPEPSQAVTDGVRFDSLVLPADLTTSTSTVESDRIALIVVKRAIQIYYRSMKRFEEANFWEAETTKGMSRLLSNLPAGIPDKPVPYGSGSLTKHMR